RRPPGRTLFPYPTLFRSVVIQGEGQAGGVYGQGSVYVQPAPGQQQPVQAQPYGSPYVQQAPAQPQPVRTVVHTSPTTALLVPGVDRKSTRLNSSHVKNSY